MVLYFCRGLSGHGTLYNVETMRKKALTIQAKLRRARRFWNGHYLVSSRDPIRKPKVAPSRRVWVGNRVEKVELSEKLNALDDCKNCQGIGACPGCRSCHECQGAGVCGDCHGTGKELLPYKGDAA